MEARDFFQKHPGKGPRVFGLGPGYSRPEGLRGPGANRPEERETLAQARLPLWISRHDDSAVVGLWFAFVARDWLLLWDFTPYTQYPLFLGYHVNPLLKKEVFTMAKPGSPKKTLKSWYLE